MTYPKPLEKLIAKDYAYPALLFTAAIIVSVIEIFAVSFGSGPYFMLWSRLCFCLFGMIALIVFIFMRKYVNFYDVAATGIMAMIALADLANLIATTMLFIGGELGNLYTATAELFPSGFFRYRIVSTELYTQLHDGAVYISEFRFGFSFFGILSSLCLIGTVIFTQISKKCVDNTLRIRKIQKITWLSAEIAVAILLIIFVVLMFVL